MFIVILRFSEKKNEAASFMEGHNQWIKKGFEDGVFLVVGSLQPGLGGVVFAHGISRKDLEDFVSQDPFVIEGVVAAEILEIEAKKATKQLRFLLT